MTTKNFSRKVVTPVRFQVIKEDALNPQTLWMNGFTTDVSLDGVKITAPMSEAEVETLVNQYVLIKLSFQLPGTSKAINATASIAYFVRDQVMSNAAMITLGASFVTIDYSAQDVIGEFIHHRINFQPLNKMYHFLDKKVSDVRRRHLIPCMA
jgi:hypothetical protein